MRIIPYGKYNHDHIIEPPYYTEKPEQKYRKTLSSTQVKAINNNFNNGVYVDNQMAIVGKQKKLCPLRTTKETVFPDRFIYKYSNFYKTTTKEDYK